MCELCDDDLRNGSDGAPVGFCELVVCEGHQGGFHVACVRALLSLRRGSLPDGHPVAIDWSTEHMQRGARLRRCGACVKEGRWGISHLIESAVTFSDARCAPKSATYSVLVRFHADGPAPEPRFCMVALRQAVRIPTRFRTLRCTKIFAIASTAACVEAKTSTGS